MRNPMLRRSSPLLAIVLAAAMIITGFSLPAGAQKAHPPVTIASVGPDWTVTVVPWVAHDLGFWAEEGLTDVTITVVGPAPTHVGALIGGSIDFSLNLSTDTLMRANAGGGDVYAIAGSTNGASYALFARPGINSVEDLRGGTVATDAPGGTAELLTADLLRHLGVRPGVDVRYVPVAGSITARLQAMMSGVTDAALGSIADWPALRQDGFTNLGRLSDALPNYQFAVMAATGNMIRNHPETVVAFLKGLIKAWNWLADPANDERARQILEANGYPVNAELFPEMIGLQREYWPVPDGSPNMAGIEAVREREIRVGRIDPDYQLSQLMRLEPLRQAQRELGL